jgi:hypothetical protein
MKKTLIVGDVWACDSLTAGIALKKFIFSISNFTEVSTFILIDRSLSKQIPNPIGCGKNFYISKPNEFWDGPRLMHRILSPLISYFTFREIGKIKSHLNEVIDELKPDHIIFVLQGQSAIILAKEMVVQGFSYSTITWDPWSWWTITHQVPRKIDAYVRKSLIDIYERGRHLVPTMTYSKVNGISENSFQVVYFPELPSDLKKSLEFPKVQIHIVFSGQNYASKELSIFIDALSAISWRFESKEIYLNIVGAKISHSSPNIINHGWVDHSRLPSFLAQFTIAFLPYPTDSTLSEVSEQSFPSKVSSYASAGLPIIYLGPKGTEVLDVISSFATPLQVLNDHVLNLENVLRKIDSNYLDLSGAAVRSYLKYFSYSSFDSNLSDWGNAVNLKLVQQALASEITKSSHSYHNLGRVNEGSVFIRRIQILLSRRVFGILLVAVTLIVTKIRQRSLNSIVSLGKFISYFYVRKFQIKSWMKTRARIRSFNE